MALTHFPSRRSLPRRVARTLRRGYSDWMAEREWRRAGRPLPAPPHVKRRFLRDYARAHDLRVFVETGTLYGDTVAGLRGAFDRLHSIELDDTLFAAAQERFAGDRKITLWHGDSGDVLERVLAAVDAPALFWLDGHYSGGGTGRGVEDTPILRELQHIAHHPHRERHHLIIDDARCFGSLDGYPTAIELKRYCSQQGFKLFEQVEDFLIVRNA
jgi:hypothetical protein